MGKLANWVMDEGCDSRENSPAAARPPRPPRIQVRSQNPISNPNPLDRRTSREPSPSLRGNYRSPSPSPGGDCRSRVLLPASMGQAKDDVARSVGASPKAPSASTRVPDRLRGGGPVKPWSQSPGGSPGSPHPKSPGRPQTPKSPVRSPKSPVWSSKTPTVVPENVITPVFPATSEDMKGALTSTKTGPTYPYNVSGPVTKYGFMENATPTWAQKHHFGGKHDKLSKKRIQRRRFCFVRHPAYKELIEPEEKTCASYLDPKRKEFWRTDVDTVLKREMQEKKDRYKRLLEHIGNEKAFRKSELLRDRENRWQAFLDYDKEVKWYPGFRNNQSGVQYDIITHNPSDEYEEKRVKFESMKASYNLVKRGLYIQERMSGARPYDILSWRVLPPCRTLPEWPEDIGPPPASHHPAPKVPLNASKGPCSFALPFGPFGTFGMGTK